MRQPTLQIGPVPAVVQRVVECVSGSREQQAFPVGIFRHHPHVRERTLRNAVRDERPRLPEVGGLVDEGIAVIHQVVIHREIGGSGVKVRWLNAADSSPRRNFEILGYINPMTAAILCVPDLAVIGAGPNQTFLQRRRCDCKNHLAIKLAKIVADDST